MHCVLSHPTSYKDANLLMIKDLLENFPDYEIGYSDHTKSDENMMILTTAYNYGADILEKHFTLDKTLPGTDHGYAMDSSDVFKFRENVSFLSKINGHKNKQPLICESATRKETRRSIVAKMDIKKGKVIEESDIAFKRPGMGISPADVDDVVGKTANTDILKDTLIEFEMLE
jgi:N-acetylneuraminate synthase